MKLKITLFLSLSVLLQGCAGPLLLGLKEVRTKDTTYSFITGADFTVGAHGIDTVNNKRSIEPNQQTKGTNNAN